MKLEDIDIELNCYGAAINIYPSPMVLSMGLGYQAYKLKFGQKAKSSELVNIFDTEDDLVLASIEEQDQYYIRWLKSIGSQRGITK